MNAFNKIKIGIDASPVARSYVSGTERYTREIISNLAKIDRVNEYTLYTPKSIDSEFLDLLPNNFNQSVIPMRRFFSQIGLSSTILFNSPDILFIPGHVLPLIHPKKSIVAVHDVGFLDYPENYSSNDLWYLKFSTKFALRHSMIIVVPSNFTKKEILRKYPSVDSSKIKVCYPGLSSIMSSVSDTGLNIPTPFILFVGRIEERKNVTRIIKAFEIIQPKFPSLKLIIIGKRGHGYSEIKNKIMNSKYENNIIILENVADEEIDNYYKKASALVFPSLYEGFGFPIVEAFKNKCPVITSNCGAMKEIAGDAAILVNPPEVGDIGMAISKILTRDNLKNELTAKGEERVKIFTWEACAKRIKDLFYDLQNS